MSSTGPSGLLGALEGVSYLVVAGVIVLAAARKLSGTKGSPSVAGRAGFGQRDVGRPDPDMQGWVEPASFALLVTGVAALSNTVLQYGYIPSALPDANCFGR